jgi:ADP-dependent NAD(P)H-hydrate dehydratase / NAD(P)H-hydrate epimerase
MKILSTSQIKEADAFTIKNEPISSVDLMERAAKTLAAWIEGKFAVTTQIWIFAGPGNNGGDGLALARLLSEKGYKTGTFIISPEGGYSRDATINIGRLRAMNISLKSISSVKDFPEIGPSDLIVDALFGSGLNKVLKGVVAKLVDYLNEQKSPVLAVDIPSGLFGDDNKVTAGDSIIRAKYTLTFQFPQLAFMFAENEEYVGKWEILPIGLHKQFINSVKTDYHYIDSDLVTPLIKSRSKFSHKGQFGHCLLISGSYGRMGAAVLGTESCLRTGAGLVSTHVPARGCEILQVSVPEGMVSIDDSDICFSVAPLLDQYDAVAVGPALGTRQVSQKALHDLLLNINIPLILDADALNIIALNKEWLGHIPKNSILTPHPGEFDRLAGQHKNGHDRLISQIELSKKHKIYIVLKGAYTSVTTPEGLCYFNSSGNPGMATAGSGDVLTGILLSLLGQGFKPVDAAIAGVYIHGLAGDIASSKVSQESMKAGDISDNLGEAFKLLHGKSINDDSFQMPGHTKRNE